MKKSLNYKQRNFCHEYIIDRNGTRAYKAAYRVTKDNVAAACALKLLRNAQINAYIKSIENDFEKNCGVSKTRNLLEYAKIAYSNIGHLHNTWITLKEFDDLTDDQKAAIEIIESDTQIKLIEGAAYEVNKVKIKMHSKLTGLDGINKLMGYYATEKIEIDQKEDTRNYTTAQLLERLNILRELKKAKGDE